MVNTTTSEGYSSYMTSRRLRGGEKILQGHVTNENLQVFSLFGLQKIMLILRNKKCVESAKIQLKLNKSAKI